MSGTPYKKEKNPTLSAQFGNDAVRDFDAIAKRMKRIRSDVIQELVRAFLEYTKDGRTPNFPLIVSAESYKDISGKIVVTERSSDDPKIVAQLARIQLYAEAIAEATGAAQVVRGVAAALEDEASRSSKPVPHPASDHESTQTEHRSYGRESPPLSGRNKSSTRDDKGGA